MEINFLQNCILPVLCLSAVLSLFYIIILCTISSTISRIEERGDEYVSAIIGDFNE
jgi:hypothetical protein